MRKKKLASIVIIHFQPLELYPPVCNLVNYLEKNLNDRIIVITTKDSGRGNFQSYRNNSKKVVIERTSAIVPSSRLRFMRYLFFYLNSIRVLWRSKPSSILYFDTISSWPALLYKKRKRSKLRLLVHYHEYCSPEEYATNMLLVKAMHRQEAKMYRNSYHWISQTNEVRLQKMITDNHLESIGSSVFHIMPNYPSNFWAKSKTNNGTSKITRLVYVGSLGYSTSYLRELSEWVVKNKDHFTLDLYSHNIDEKACAFLASVSNDSIRYHAGVNYNELPDLLTDYDVGLVIYRPVSENWIHNAPNKVFEYLACGLDVWFSKTMTYTLSLTTKETFPKIIPVDFEKLDKFDFEKAISREGLFYKETNFFYENIYPEILNAISE